MDVVVKSDNLAGLSPLEQVNARKAALGHQLFEQLVMDIWLDCLWVAFGGLGFGPSGGKVGKVPDFTGGYLGGPTFIDARRYITRALGEPIDDDRFKGLVEEVIREDLEKYGVELSWIHRNSWTDRNRVLYIHSTADDTA